MKTKLLFLIAFAIIAFSGNAQIIEEDFEFYVLGDMGIQNPSVWSVWNGDPEAGGGIIVGDDGSGGQLGYIGPDSVQDALLLLQNQSFGNYTLQFEMFIPAASTGYFNVQGQTETNAGTGYEGAGDGGAGVFNSGNLYFNEAGASPGVFLDETTGETGSYPEDAWFPVSIYFDVDALTYSITVDGTIVNTTPVPFQADATLGAIDFFSIDANNNYYIDNILFYDIFIGVDDFSRDNFGVYPNPVDDVLNIRSTNTIESILVFDVLGKLVLESHPNIISPSLDMSDLNSGVYFLNVTINGTSKTVKIIK